MIMTMKNVRKTFVLFLLSLPVGVCATLLFSSVSYARTLQVPSQYGSIQSAINAAVNGDVITISDGIYRENIEVVGKYITLQGNPDRQSTVLAGNGGKTPLMIQSVPYAAGASMKVTGLKITGGSSPDGQGGGITIANNADPTIYNNTIENNTSVSHGGGILVFNNSNPLIKDNIIRQNKATYFGGGIFVVKDSAPTIVNNQITQNTAAGGQITNGGASGGGIYLEDEPQAPRSTTNPVVAGNTITNNSADFAGGGIMLRAGVNALIEKNSISNNTASYGGGIHVETEGASPKIHANTIYSNTASAKAQYGGSGFGGGVSVYASSQPAIDDNAIYGNMSTNGGAGIVLAENSSSSLQRNTIYNNAVTGSGFVQGGGVYISGATATMMNNVLYDNSAYLGGGIAAIGSNAVLTATYNTIAYNQAGHTQGGGGVFVNNNQGTQVALKNNIISDNTKYQVFEQYSNGTNVPRSLISSNIITNTGLGLYFNYSTNGVTSASTLNNSTFVDADATLDAAPQFTNGGSRVLTLSASSPAVDTGSEYVSDDKNLTLRTGSPDRGAYEYTASPAKKNLVYRFWSDVYKSHFYTIDEAEKDSVISGYLPKEWRFEYVAYGAFSDTSVAGSIPLYRFYSQVYGGHFYTVDVNEKNSLQTNPTSSNWKYEGVAYAVYPENTSQPSDMVFRFWSPNNRHHFYTSSVSEKNYIQANYPIQEWTYEGGRFAVPK